MGLILAMTLSKEDNDDSFLKTLLNELEGGGAFKIHELTVTLKNAQAFPTDLPEDSLLCLFHQQFLVMNGLFRLQDELREKGFWLQIDPLQIRLEKAPSAEAKLNQSALGPVAELKRFYLDKSNLADVTPESVADLLAGFWRRFQHLDEKSDALAVLGLKEGVEFGEIKQRYQQKVHEVHPDKGGDAAAFRQVQKAYQVLKECYT